MEADLKVKKDDYGYYIDFTVTEADGTAYNLTGYTKTFKVWDPVDEATLIVEGVCATVVDASGTCRYLVVTGDFDTPGLYSWEIELTKTGAVESTRTYTLVVEGSG